MRIRVSLLPSLSPVAADVDVAIVIDVLRATSVTAMASQNGVRGIRTCASIELAKQVRDEFRDAQGRPALLCGERLCQKIDGFDLGNSPAEYPAEVVQDREMILTTTNGTRAIAMAEPASDLWLGSFLNHSALIGKLKRDRPEVVHLVCAGTEGDVTREDVLMAGSLIEPLRREVQAMPDGDQAALADDVSLRGFGKEAPRTSVLAEELAKTLGGRNLIDRGHQSDIPRCAAIDSVDVVPVRQRIETAFEGLSSFAADGPFHD